VRNTDWPKRSRSEGDTIAMWDDGARLRLAHARGDLRRQHG
jgi:hypothetical protein